MRSGCGGMGDGGTGLYAACHESYQVLRHKARNANQIIGRSFCTVMRVIIGKR